MNAFEAPRAVEGVDETFNAFELALCLTRWADLSQQRGRAPLRP